MLYVMMGDIKVAQYDEDFNIRILREDLAPLYLTNGGSIYNWVSGRAVDFHRSNSRSLKKKYSLSRNASDYVTAMKMNAVKITDNFWVKPEYDPRKFEDVRYKRDDFFSLALYRDIDCLDKNIVRTPELTNIGAQEKAWKLENGSWWLYKNEKPAEIVSEYLTYRLGVALGFDMAEYKIVDKGKFIKTKDFTEGKYNLQHMNSIVFDHVENGIEVPDDDLSYNYRVLKELGFGEQYLNICMLDALCENFDRHTENYGVLTDNKTGKIVKMAPNYDNNNSFFANYNLSTDRNRAYMRVFLKFIKDEGITLKVPELDEVEVVKILDEVYSMTDYKFDKVFLKDFIMNGYKLLVL